MPHIISKLASIDIETWRTKSDKEIAELMSYGRQTVYEYRRKYNLPPDLKKRQSPHYKLTGRRSIHDLDYEYSYIIKRGEKKGSNAWKKAVKKHYGLACCVCGYYKEKVSNHCHHRLPLSQDGKNTVRNGVVLCSRCHEEEHAGYLDLTNL